MKGLFTEKLFKNWKNGEELGYTFPPEIREFMRDWNIYTDPDGNRYYACPFVFKQESDSDDINLVGHIPIDFLSFLQKDYVKYEI